MLIPLQPPETWDRLNEAYRLKVGYKLDNPVKCYQNLYLAVDEVTTQLASFLSHKKAFTWMKGMSPVFDATLPYFLREGFQSQSVDWKVLEQFKTDVQAWVQALPASTLFVLFFEEHAVTAQKTDVAVFEKYLAEKKIYLIRVSHFFLPSPSEEISPFTVWIGPANPGPGARALAVCGARFRAPEKVAAFGPWQPGESAVVEHLKENQNLIQKIEMEFEGFCWFSKNDLRRYDRLVLCFPDLTGDQIIKRLSQLLDASSAALGPELAQTTHFCRWESIKVFKNWWTPEPSPEQLRGLVVFSLNIAQRDDFVSKLKQTLSELRAESQWG